MATPLTKENHLCVHVFPPRPPRPPRSRPARPRPAPPAQPAPRRAPFFPPDGWTPDDGEPWNDGLDGPPIVIPASQIKKITKITKVPKR